MSRFRLASHHLEIENGRFNNIQREHRTCKVCSQNLVETEYHFLLCCPLYRSLRTRYLKNISWVSLTKFTNILSSVNPKIILNTAYFISQAMKVRQEKLKLISAS